MERNKMNIIIARLIGLATAIGVFAALRKIGQWAEEVESFDFKEPVPAKPVQDNETILDYPSQTPITMESER